MILDALACIRNSKGREVLVAFAIPPESAAASWWYLQLLRSWFRLSRSAESAGAVLAVLGLPFDPTGLPLLLRSGRRASNQATHAPVPVYFLPDGEDRSRLDSAEAWLRLPELGWARVCPWDEPTLAGSPSGPWSYIGGRVPASPRGKLVREWVDASGHPVAQALHAGLQVTHGESSLVEALLLYPAFSAQELALVTGLRSRSVRRALQRLKDMGLVEALPLFARERRAVLTSRGLDLLAFKAIQTPARFRLRRAWPTDHGALTRSPRHMQYVLAFMLALRRGGRLASWDLVRARYEYCVAVAPGDLTRPRRVELVPDSSGILRVDGREVPFWLEIDRGTRNGVRLTRQLEKYILARFGYAASDPLPLLLYVVAEGGESRARLVARRLIDLSTRYRLRRIPAILITTWELLTNGDPSRPPEPPRAVWRLPFRWKEYVLPLPPLAGLRILQSRPQGRPTPVSLGESINEFTGMNQSTWERAFVA
ncbi:MAG: replication-relaxation family protein [Chloroflexota bacterium]